MRITDHIDLPQAAFWIFFLLFCGLVWWLRQQDKREGYPMKASPFDRRRLEGFPAPPPGQQVYLLNEGGTTGAPHVFAQPPTQAVPLYPFDGTPFSPVGNPLLAALGPGAWVMRRDEPMLTEKGELVLQPLRLLPEWSVTEGETDLRGMLVLDRRFKRIGTVHDIWIDQAIRIIRLLEVELRPELAAGRTRRVLVPIYHTAIDERERQVRVTALRTYQFAEVPIPTTPDRITAREDERLNAYFAAGYFYRDSPLTAPPARS